MKNKELSKKELLRDNVKLTNQLNNCVKANMELKLLHEQMTQDIEKANKKFQSWIDFVNDKYPELWNEFKDFNKPRPNYWHSFREEDDYD